MSACVFARRSWLVLALVSAMSALMPARVATRTQEPSVAIDKDTPSIPFGDRFIVSPMSISLVELDARQLGRRVHACFLEGLP